MMRRLFLPALILTLVTFAAGPSQAAEEGEDTEKIKTEVMQAEREITQALATKDTTALNRMLADELAWTARGALLTKAQVIADLQSGNFRNQSPKHDDFRLHVYANGTVVLTGHSTSEVHYNGKISYGPRWYTNVYVRQPDGQWQLVVHSVVDQPQ